MSTLEPGNVTTKWLTVPDLVDVLGEPQGRVRRLLDERFLVGSRRNGPLTVPAAFIQEGAPIGALRGTIIALEDVGLSDDEAIDWLLAHDDSIGAAPITALRAGHKSEVRRVARTLI